MEKGMKMTALLMPNDQVKIELTFDGATVRRNKFDAEQQLVCFFVEQITRATDHVLKEEPKKLQYYDLSRMIPYSKAIN